MDLLAKRQIFSHLIAKLILAAKDMGYEITIGEVFRPKEMAKIYAARGKGILNSNHVSGLAADLNLFKDGEYLSKSEDYELIGEVWEAMGGDLGVITCWGGRFKKRPDGNHFSLEHNGIR